MRYDISPGGVLVQIHDSSPSDAEWTQLLTYMLKNRERIRYVLAISRGNGSPSSKQRERLAETLRSFPPQLPFALLTDSRIARGVLTALNWMTGRAKYTAVFGPDELGRALIFFGVGEAETLATRQLVARIDGPETPLSRSL